MNIYIGNLAHETTDVHLRQEFEAFGKVTAVNVVKNRRNGQSKGFAYVEMADREEGLAAIEGLRGHTLNDRMMDVTEGAETGKGKKGGFKGGGKKRRRF